MTQEDNGGKHQRLSINITTDIARKIRVMARDRDTTATNIVQSAVRLFWYVYENVLKQPDRELCIVDNKTGKQTKLHILT